MKDMNPDDGETTMPPAESSTSANDNRAPALVEPYRPVSGEFLPQRCNDSFWRAGFEPHQ